MQKFLLLLLIVFIFLFIGKQSHFIEKKEIYDERLSVKREDYQLNWNNLTTYVNDIPAKIKGIFSNPKPIR